MHMDILAAFASKQAAWCFCRHAGTVQCHGMLGGWHDGSKSWMKQRENDALFTQKSCLLSGLRTRSGNNDTLSATQTCCIAHDTAMQTIWPRCLYIAYNETLGREALSEYRSDRLTAGKSGCSLVGGRICETDTGRRFSVVAFQSAYVAALSGQRGIRQPAADAM